MATSTYVFSAPWITSLSDVLRSDSWLIVENEIRIPSTVWSVLYTFTYNALHDDDQEEFQRMMRDRVGDGTDFELVGDQITRSCAWWKQSLNEFQRRIKQDASTLEKEVLVLAQNVPIGAHWMKYDLEEYERDISLVWSCFKYADLHDQNILYWHE